MINKYGFHTDATYADRRKAEKKSHYTIESIGGAKELAEWKASQKYLEAQYQAAQVQLRAERRQNAVSIVNGASPARELTEVEKAELAYRETRRKPPERSKPVSMLFSPELPTMTPRPSKGLYDHFKSLCASIWRNAFDSERQ